MIILWIIISIIFLTSRSLEVEIRRYSGKRAHGAHDRIVGYKKSIPNAGLKSDQSNQTSIIEPLNEEISNKESIPNEKFKPHQQNRTVDKDTLEDIEAILSNQILDEIPLNIEIRNEKSSNKEFKLDSSNQTFFNAPKEEMAKIRRVRSIFYVQSHKPSKQTKHPKHTKHSKPNKHSPVKNKPHHSKEGHSKGDVHKQNQKHKTHSNNTINEKESTMKGTPKSVTKPDKSNQTIENDTLNELLNPKETGVTDGAKPEHSIPTQINDTIIKGETNGESIPTGGIEPDKSNRTPGNDTLNELLNPKEPGLTDGAKPEHSIPTHINDTIIKGETNGERIRTDGIKPDRINQTIASDTVNQHLNKKETESSDGVQSDRNNRIHFNDTIDKGVSNKKDLPIDDINLGKGNRTIVNDRIDERISKRKNIPTEDVPSDKGSRKHGNGTLDEEINNKNNKGKIPTKGFVSNQGNQFLSKYGLNKEANNKKGTSSKEVPSGRRNGTLNKKLPNKDIKTHGTKFVQHNQMERKQILSYNALNENMEDKKCIKWGTIPSTGLLSDYFIYVGAYIHPRPSREYVAFFDGILLQNNVALTNVMFNSTVLTQIRRTRSEGFTVLNAVDYQATPDIKKTRFIYDAKNYDEWLNSVNDIDKFQRIPSNKKGVQLALIKLNQSYDIEVKTLLLGRPLNKKDRCVVFLRMKSEIKAIPIKMYSRDECKKQQPEYEEGTCFSNANEQILACYIKPGAPIFCSGFLAGIVRWTDNCSISNLIPYADTYKYLQWITQMTDNVHKSDNCPTIVKTKWITEKTAIVQKNDDCHPILKIFGIHCSSMRLSLKKPSLIYICTFSCFLFCSYIL